MALISLEEAKSYLRVDTEDEDAMIAVLLSSAGRLCADVARLTDEQIMEIHALRSKSVSYGRIAITLGISIDTVKSHCRRHKTVPIQSSCTDVDKKRKAVQSSRTYKRWKSAPPEPVCEVSVSYSSNDTDALPFLLETLASVFFGR